MGCYRTILAARSPAGMEGSGSYLPRRPSFYPETSTTNSTSSAAAFLLIFMVIVCVDVINLTMICSDDHHRVVLHVEVGYANKKGRDPPLRLDVLTTHLRSAAASRDSK